LAVTSDERRAFTSGRLFPRQLEPRIQASTGESALQFFKTAMLIRVGGSTCWGEQPIFRSGHGVDVIATLLCWSAQLQVMPHHHDGMLSKHGETLTV
jgi:hypothetical protein